MLRAQRPDRDYIESKIHELYAERYTAREIAEILATDPRITSRVTVSSVQHDIFRMRTQSYRHEEDHPWTESETTLLENVYRAGQTILELSKRTNHNYGSVLVKLQSSGFMNRRLSPAQQAVVRHFLYSTEDSLSDIAQQLGVKYSSVQHIWSRMKLTHPSRFKRRGHKVTSAG